MSSLLSREKVEGLARKAAIGGEVSFSQIEGGANNRVYKVKADGAGYLLKEYFKHQGDLRDRLMTEYSFLSYAWECGIRSVPRPYAMDRDNNIALYDFIEGRRLRAGDVGEEEIAQAIELFSDLNEHKDKSMAKSLPVASEARFSVSGHLNAVEKRIDDLEKMTPSSGVDMEAAEFIKDKLSVKWGMIKGNAVKLAKQLNIFFDREIDSIDRCISPSDFGFHNAILAKDARLRFIDFEYAGWDDPAKMVCDFFCQPEVPVPFKFFDEFTQAAVSKLSDPGLHQKRIEVLFPAIKIKWCCILLNEFLAVGSERRRYAQKDMDYERLKMEQLEKSRMFLKGIKI